MPECFLIEPTETETETKEAMDDFIDAMAKILEEANTNPETVTEAPFTQPVLSMAIYFDPPLANKIDPPFIV